MFDLTGKRALVTGASGGIGSEIARVLSEAGAAVALSGTRVDKLEAVAAGLATEAAILPCNLASLAEVDRLVPDAEAALGGIDILVNNAGMTRDGLFMRMKDEDWDDVLAVNLTAAFHITRAVLRGMMKRRYGRIVGISSVVGVAGNGGQANYAATKAGLIGMNKSLAQEVASRNITVNSVAPGFVSSAMTDEMFEKQSEAMLARIPAGRLGKASEVAAAVLFLASEEAGYITGHTLNINGGMLML
ncbi:MAG: 3-oxoacyl-[acyl-carrier-protein] reductase [Alphaproteobacteria bacterium]|nr:3-oxoacyl-[acyl-carrier-protein] reductase [Alphaproteobacteria bacterium]